MTKTRSAERLRAIQQQIVQALSDEALERLAHGENAEFAWLASLSDEQLERLATASHRPGRPHP